ncbi:class I SAM-dependent methyltransferase [Terasakiella sp. SH-1]|uniref:class I SAM-dependent methyltransferase n=1 Tax=Terasakiella sp. SH-1 TaxID=2560057 RepID=UPI001072F45A|nr:class I SAM-dependent methyltransferase [Terasakiella sp. SH-1]
MQKRKNADVLKETLELAGKKVLDIGSGEGHLTRMMAKQGAHVIGLECSERQMEKALSYETVADERFMDGVGQDLPFDDETQDIIVFFNSLHHIPLDEQFNALKEAVRVLKKGGQIYISEPIAEGPHFELLQPIDDETHVRAVAYDNIKRYAELGLSWEAEEIYNHPVRRKSFEELHDKLTGPNPEREKIFEDQDVELRAAFDRLGDQKADGLTYFDQPTRMNLLKK